LFGWQLPPFGLHCQVNLDVAVGRRDAHVSEPTAVEIGTRARPEDNPSKVKLSGFKLTCKDKVGDREAMLIEYAPEAPNLKGDAFLDSLDFVSILKVVLRLVKWQPTGRAPGTLSGDAARAPGCGCCSGAASNTPRCAGRGGVPSFGSPAGNEAWLANPFEGALGAGLAGHKLFAFLP
jgi:hypothetical protein